MDIRFRIHRMDAEVDVTPRYQVYTVDVDGEMTVLDALHEIKWYQDGTVTFRRSCRSAICGSCGMLINGRNRLACNTRVTDLDSEEVSVSPLPGFPVLRDLVVDWDPFFAKDAAMKPYLINDQPPPEKERRQSPAEYDAIDNATLCIQCGCCSSACPIVWNNGEYYGPAALTRAVPLCVRFARYRHPRAPAACRFRGRRLALPYDFQLHQRLPQRGAQHP